MKERIRLALLFVYRLLDLTGLAAALWLAFYYGAPVGIDYLISAFIEPSLESTIFFAGILASWMFMLSSLWLYRSKRLTKWEDEFADTFRAVVFATLILATQILIAEWPVFPKRFLLIFAFASFTSLFLIRLAKRNLLRQFRLHGRNLRSVVVIGGGPRGQQVVRLIEENADIGYHFAGFVDNLNIPRRVGSLAEFPRILARNVIDEVIICLPIKTFYNEIQAITEAAEEQGVTVRIYSDLFNLKLARAVAGELGDTPILSIYSTRLTNWQALLKGLIDFTCGLVLLVLLSPLMLAIAVLIKLTSPGPVFFVQERIGLNKRRFKMFKFRTMVADAPAMQHALEQMNEADGPVFKMRNDPRVTRVGRWLRKRSLDELPQLLNVLLGDLSLVGPRPLPERDYDRFDKRWFNRRFSVKPGITCIWQISGRSETTFEKWIIQDLEYIDKWSISLDFKILFKTIPSVLRGTGAM